MILNEECGREEEDQEADRVHRGCHGWQGTPGGERDISDRLHIFGARIDFERIALNMDQVEQYGPPPNPAKLSDSRAGGYIAEFGDSSWELDALSPSVLANLIRDTVEAVRDDDLWNKAVEREEEERERIIELAEQLED